MNRDERREKDFDGIMARLGYVNSGMGNIYRNEDRVWKEMLSLHRAGLRFTEIASRIGFAPWRVAKIFHQHNVWPSYLVND